GLPGVSRPHPLLQNSLSFYYLALIVLSVVMACVWLISRSPFGLILRGIREKELRSSTLGIQTRWHKYVVFVIAGVVAAIAGVLNASYIGFVSPRDLSVELSFDAMLMVIVGGAGTLAGPAIGALLVTALRYLLSVYVPNYWLIVLGTVFIAVTIWLPDGVVGVGRRLRRFSHATSEPDFAAL